MQLGELARELVGQEQRADPPGCQRLRWQNLSASFYRHRHWQRGIVVGRVSSS